jgi:5'-nucleotidase
MRVLVTNDDGIYAKGIEALYISLEREHEVIVVAPESERSAVGHAITFLDPLRIKSINRNGKFFGYAVDGYPADCVKLAVDELLKPVPEIVVSGINLGANVGVNVIYSGTVSAATEAAMLGIPSVAVSLDCFEDPDFTVAAEFTLEVLRQIQEHGLPPGVSLNVNVPNVSAEEIRGVRVTRQGDLKFLERYDRRIDPRSHVYYWLCSSKPVPAIDPDSDFQAVAEGFISVTPIHYDLTHYEALKSLNEWSFSIDMDEGAISKGRRRSSR